MIEISTNPTYEVLKVGNDVFETLNLKFDARQSVGEEICSFKCLLGLGSQLGPIGVSSLVFYISFQWVTGQDRVQFSAWSPEFH